MKVRDLERLLIERGVGAAKIDAVTRRLRHSGRLPKGGRGPNAPDIDAREAATILLAVAGSSTGAEADLRLEKLERLPFRGVPDVTSPTLLQALTGVLEAIDSMEELVEVRVSRTSRKALFVYDAGRTEEYRTTNASNTDKFYVEGVLPGRLLSDVRRELARHAGQKQRSKRSN
jgi:hypothetical protein